MIAWIDPAAPPDAFPPVETALREPDGLLAAGGDLSPARLVAAYRRGIFPWFSDGQPILWWCPDPRAVFPAGTVHLARRLRRRIRQLEPVLVIDGNFECVIDACAAPRPGEPGTWITDTMRDAYLQLWRAGVAHCAEAVVDGRVVGGVYGLAIGRVFFGESMYSTETDGSKLALVGLDRWLAAGGYRLLDAQVESGHIARLGAERWPRSRFVAACRTACDEEPARLIGPARCALSSLL